ncbi:helix-turn-helix domain-containing protein [Exiguobacterium acetylicum]|uniref:helix-turn-helix domain-containing protein n=1 Tax=Exiguobacterium TaxID=33986 RepID=UPI00044FAF51|nr:MULTISPECIES: helix-turn-helix domain-containing protein [Exiguobacterium]EZP60978.1 Transcriptional regulator, XRE family [Exiguobacterium sp. RIT341]MDQ6466990.1 helix-turn-helix domain-containing protein [Exiguobacterium acetylicum]
MNHLPVSIGYEIKRLRKEKKITQAELCEGICSQAEISKVENGKNSPTIDLLQQVAKRLKVPLSMLFQDHLRSDVFQSYDEQLADLLRTNQYVDALKLSEHVLSTTEYEQVRNLARYYQVIVQERSGQIHYLKAVQSLERLLNKEQLWFESATLYLRIQMGMANLYVEHGDFELADDLFQNLIQAKYETIELKKVRIKILYNYGQQLSLQKKYLAGLKITEQGIQESLQLEDGHFLGHFYFQRGYFKQQLNGDLSDIQRDFTMAYSLFCAFDMPIHEKRLLEEYAEYVLFPI